MLLIFFLYKIQWDLQLDPEKCLKAGWLDSFHLICKTDLRNDLFNFNCSCIFGIMWVELETLWFNSDPLLSFVKNQKKKKKRSINKRIESPIFFIFDLKDDLIISKSSPIPGTMQVNTCLQKPYEIIHILIMLIMGRH